ncbi:MAG: HDIG domain-containing protein [Planctomycetaceae bacterium]|nr:HDIG domain-containing protein [Planctomycetaceae bacterium]
MTPTRDEAFALLCEFNKTDKAIKHALAVEAVMGFLAAKRGGDAEQWGLAGLIHDLDFEQFPQEHCTKTAEILRQRGWPEEMIRAAASHGWGACSDVEPLTDMEKTLYAVDELTGLVAASALVRPSKSIMDLEVKSVKKKWKEKSFAAGVDRSVIEKGAAMMRVSVDELMGDVIAAMRGAAEALGLAGQ